jgi:methanesulfonate monooxygenase small subunit
VNIVMPDRSAVDREVARLVYRASMLLDEKDFKGWLDLSTEEFTYSITAYSYEIRKEVTWLDLNLEKVTALVRMLPRHNTDQSTFTRHTTVYTVDRIDDTSAKATSAVSIYRTALDGGQTSIFAVGKYYDTIDLSGEEPRFRARRLRLDTRMLGIGTHYPL